MERVRPNMKMNKSSCMTMPDRTQVYIREVIAAARWTVLFHLGLTPSDFHLFGLLKDALKGSRFAVDKLKNRGAEEFRRFGKEV
jgi:hypothetical protein